MSPHETSNETIPCQYFRWRLIRRASGVYYADGRSRRGPNLGRDSLGCRDRAQALEALRQLDLQVAVQHGLADRRMLELQHDQMLPIDRGISLYMGHVARPEVAGGSPAAQRRYRAVFAKFAAFAVERGITFWQQVGGHTLHDYAAYLDGHEYAYATQLLELTTLKQAIKHLREDRQTPGIAQVRLKLQKPNDTSTYCFTTEQVGAMLEHCRQEPALHWLERVIIALARTGVRISELAALRWADVDLEQETIHLPDRSRHGSRHQRERARKTKGRRSRTIPLHPELRAVLEALAQHRDGHIFHGPRAGRLKPDTVLRILKRDVIQPLAARFPSQPGEPGFADATVHSFRHYFCSECANRGVPEQMLMSWLGHADSRMVRRYYHSDRQASRQWMARLTYTPSAGARAAERGTIARDDSNPEAAASPEVEGR